MKMGNEGKKIKIVIIIFKKLKITVPKKTIKK